MEGDGWPKQPYLGKSNHSAFSNTGLPWNKTLLEISNPFSRQHELMIDCAGFDVLKKKKKRLVLDYWLKMLTPSLATQLTVAVSDEAGRQTT